MNTKSPIMLINVDTCTNLDEVKAMVGVAWKAGFKVTSSCVLLPNAEHLLAIAIPGCSVNQHKYRKLCYKIGLYAQNNLGPVTIENDGTVWQTHSRSSHPVTLQIGELDVGKGIFNLEVPTPDGGMKLYNISPDITGGDSEETGRCFIDD